MPDSSPGPGSVVRSLLVAMLNATLMLVALCLWLGWHVLSEARAITTHVTDTLTLVTPVKDEIAGLRAEVAGLRGDLAGAQGQAAGSAAMTAFGDRLAALEGRFAATGEKIDTLSADPAVLIDRAIDRTAMQIKAGIASCTTAGT